MGVGLDVCVARMSVRKKERKDIFYLTTHSTHFLFTVYMASDRIYGKGSLR